MEVLLIDLVLLLVGVNRELCLGGAWNYGRGYSNRNLFLKFSIYVNILIRIFAPNNPGVAAPWSRKLTLLEAELMGIRQALSWLKSNERDFVDVESDSLWAVLEIQAGGSLSAAGSNFTSISLAHV
ncbi:unnamed protein product [Cuscuta epithymum]|uniref:RNase H type-1 domain-containing protein n=1 Tax=Cuscuta epithymum TaxID=186058 RepID=A0AAV0GFK1_9ASTE|nr:unnamed protein product [Cuscuta epithymum]CAH9146640.1 unnamed protein product [Cuscuta epithymum]